MKVMATRLKKEGKIPTWVGLIFLVVLLGLTVWGVGTKGDMRSRAGADCEPKSLLISNVNEKSFAVSWLSDGECEAAITLKQDSRLFFDKRGQEWKGKSHFVIVDNLKAETLYEFLINSNGESMETAQMRTRTAGIPKTGIPEADLAWGKVLVSEGVPAEGAIVSVAIAGAAPLSALVSSNGNFAIPLSVSFNESLTDWFETPKTAERERILVTDTEGERWEFEGSTDDNTPVPDIVLSRGSGSLVRKGAEPTTGSQDSFLQGMNEGGEKTTDKITLENPKDGEIIHTDLPEFFGEAPAGVTLEIKVESPSPYEGEVVSSGDGKWSWSPPAGLEPGEHKITIRAINPTSGVLETIVRTFVVSAKAAESDPAFVSTPSASLSPSEIPTLAPSATTAPTKVLASPTDIYRAAQVATDTAVPESGIVLPTILTPVGGIILVVMAGILLF